MVMPEYRRESPDRLPRTVSQSTSNKEQQRALHHQQINNAPLAAWRNPHYLLAPMLKAFDAGRRVITDVCEEQVRSWYLPVVRLPTSARPDRELIGSNRPCPRLAKLSAAFHGAGMPRQGRAGLLVQGARWLELAG